ncbi:MAG: hypothetical protein K6B72_07240 [Lachnospiraceae bacterium]|nr:hypothetical protein [Lachnospiraceae bacterium]
MYGIFMESWVMFKLYAGGSLLVILYIAALILLFFKERRKPVRIVLLYLPVLILFLFFFPLFRKLYVRVTSSGDTQYRMLWLVPMGMTVAFAGCRLSYLLPMRGARLNLKRAFDRVLLPAVIGLVIILCGTLVYRNGFMKRAENVYHIPQEAIEVCEQITRDLPEEERIIAAVPADMVHYVRQYDTDIILAYGRDIIAYGYYNEVHEKMEKADPVNMEELSEALRESQTTVLVLRRDKAVDREPGDCGWKLDGETEHYLIYRDTD